ncbi:MAG: hypothetical protein J6X39_07655 [Bacteroidales bacterium]|nr:hypothetical protein [Bacteroidales bacterium]
MDINQLSTLVRSLILDSDEVLVPGLGTFRAEVVPASFSDKGFTVNPPYRKLTFVSEELEGAAKVEAEGLEECVAKLKKELNDTRCVELTGLGKLRLTKSDQYFFVPDEDADIYPEGFGLEPVSLKNKDARSESGTTEGPAGTKKAGAKRWKLFKSQKAEPRKPKAPKEKKPRNPKRTAIIVAVIIVDIILIAIVALKVLGAVAPDFLDKLLYTEEELAIIHNTL